MSLILKGIDMPKEGETLVVSIHSDGKTWVDRGREWELLTTEAIQIDRPHGRLIDEDKIFDLIFDLINCQDFLQRKDGKWVQMFQTILEAEDE